MNAPIADSFYRLPHHMTYPPLASGIYWVAVCQCHFGRIVGLNPYADRSKAGAR